jgi:hypothetical protein
VRKCQVVRNARIVGVKTNLLDQESHNVDVAVPGSVAKRVVVIGTRISERHSFHVHKVMQIANPVVLTRYLKMAMDARRCFEKNALETPIFFVHGYGSRKCLRELII